MANSTSTDCKHFIPLESNPIVFTDLIHKLGVSQSLAFSDVLSLEDPELLAFVPRPVHALVLVFPTSTAYEARKAESEAARVEYTGSGAEQDVIWFKQTIHNACGLYAILHAVCNGEARRYIRERSILSRFLREIVPLAPGPRARALEEAEELEKAYTAAAMRGDSIAPDSPEAEVDFHFICLVKSAKNGHLYHMDGDSKGPIDLGREGDEGEDLLSDGSLGVIKEYVALEKSESVYFSLMALCPNEE